MCGTSLGAQARGHQIDFQEEPKMMHVTEPFISAEMAYRQEKIRASFANAEARRRYRL
jgi:hypothetical protein